MPRPQTLTSPPPATKPAPARSPRRSRNRRPRRASEQPRWDLAGVALAWLAGLS